MNETVSFALERVGMALTDLYACIKNNVFVPEYILFAKNKRAFSEQIEYERFYKNDTWGGFDQYGWFHYDFTVPEVLMGRPLWMELTQDKREWYAQNPQFLVYCNGAPIQGADIYHEEVRISSKTDQNQYKVDVAAWAGMVTRGRTWSDMENRPGRFSIRFYAKDEEIESLYYDLKVPYEILKLLGETNDTGIMLSNILTKAVDMLDFRDAGTLFKTSVKKVSEYLHHEFYEKADTLEGPTAMSVGHTHIDVAWMWQFEHTKLKTARSFSTALKLLEEYPEYTFMSSQPQLYEYYESQLPDKFREIEEYVKSGRWEPEGGMWVEADCNLTSGESLIRQFLIGKEYFKQKFGYDSKVLWLPDVFGYSAALPQICKGCGIDYFMTTKISWNEQNKIPYDTFLWKGIDGTDILTHFAPAKQWDKTDYNPFGFARSPHITTYNSDMNPDYIMGGWKRYSQKKLNTTYLIPFGYGDGGGGTTREMIEHGKRMQFNLPGCPRVEFSSSLNFFKQLEKEVAESPELPVWYGELYLEFHRGTYTSVAEVKKNNRLAENMLQQAEFLASCAEIINDDFVYPQKSLKEITKLILTNQFHDILPGSALDEVYADCEEIYERIFVGLTGIMEQSRNAILNQFLFHGIVVTNTLGFSRNGIIRFECKESDSILQLEDGKGNRYLAQRGEDGLYTSYIENIPASGSYGYTLSTTAEFQKNMVCHEEADCFIIETPWLRINLNKNGRLNSVYDMEKEREVLSAQGNVLECYEDRPYQYDAWEISTYYRRKQYFPESACNIRIVEEGPVRIGIEYESVYMSSRIVQTMYVYAQSRRIDFHTRIDWKEQHTMLKVAFPVDIVSQKASYEIQFGVVERPVHTNTSWDAEKFETCAQRWADYSESDYGIALLNDCKYGYDIHDGVMRLTLLRSPEFPNHRDQGKHEFTYSIYPHAGDWKEAAVQKEAYDLNHHVLATAVERDAAEQKETLSQPLIQCDTEGIFIETFKKSEDGQGYIVRAYEGFGGRKNAKFKLADSWLISETNLIEEPGDNAICESGNRFEAVFRPFEIKTFKMQK